MIRILFVVPNLQGGGAERVIVHLARGLDRDRFTVALAVGLREGIFLRDVPKDVRLFELGAERARHCVFPLVRVVRRWRPNLVMATLGMAIASVLARPRYPSGTRVITRLGNSIGAFLDEAGRGAPWARWAQALASTLMVLGADRVVAQSDFMIRDAVGRLPVSGKRFVRIYNPVDIDRIHAAASERPPSSSTVGRERAGPHLVSVGRLSWQKGYDLLLKAFVTVRKEWAEATLTILGEGEDRADLEAQIHDEGLSGAVYLPGFCENPFPAIRAADLFVSSSRYEGLSNAMLESLGLGIPVVATDCPGGGTEILQEGSNGWLAPADDPSGLAQTILNALSARCSLDAALIEARVRDRFGSERICAEYEEMFLSLVAGGVT